MSENSGVTQDVVITEMSQNMLIRINVDGTIDAKISLPRKPGDARTGLVRINQKLYQTTATEFTRIYPS